MSRKQILLHVMTGVLVAACVIAVPAILISTDPRLQSPHPSGVPSPGDAAVPSADPALEQPRPRPLGVPFRMYTAWELQTGESGYWYRSYFVGERGVKDGPIEQKILFFENISREWEYWWDPWAHHFWARHSTRLNHEWKARLLATGSSPVLW